MSEAAVLYAVEAGVATLTMNRSQVFNALNDDLAQMPTRAYDPVKQALALSSGNGRGEQLEVEGRLQAEAMATEDHKQGVAAFLAKRPASFNGR